MVEYKRVLKITLNIDEELVLKDIKFDSKKVHTTRPLYREYIVDDLLDSLTDDVAKSLDIQEKVQTEL